MGSLRRFVKISLAGSLCCSLAVLAGTAEVKPEDAVKFRRSAFTVIQWNFAPLGAMVKGDIPFDADAVNRHAEFLKTLSKMPIEGFTPNTKGVESKAKPEIWENWAEFEKYMLQFQEQVDKLSAVAATRDEKAIKAQIGNTAKACKTCHEEYRNK